MNQEIVNKQRVLIINPTNTSSIGNMFKFIMANVKRPVNSYSEPNDTDAPTVFFEYNLNNRSNSSLDAVKSFFPHIVLISPLNGKELSSEEENLFQHIFSAIPKAGFLLYFSKDKALSKIEKKADLHPDATIVKYSTAKVKDKETKKDLEEKGVDSDQSGGLIALCDHMIVNQEKVLMSIANFAKESNQNINFANA